MGLFTNVSTLYHAYWAQSLSAKKSLQYTLGLCDCKYQDV